MSCQECELRLAEGDFGRAVEDHLLECAECRDLAEELRENAIAMRAMRDEPLRILLPRVVRRPPIWIPAAVAAAVVLLAFGLLRHPERTVALPPVAPVAASAPASALEAAAPAPLRKARPRVVKPRPELPEETLMVKMLTPDPDVVIYWIVEPKERTE